MRLVLLLSLALLSVGLQAEIIIENATVYATAPGQPNAAAFMRIKNTGKNPVTLEKLHSDVAKKTELHEQIQKDGMLRMQAVENFSIAPGEQQTLTPGGKHIMLMGLDKPLKTGDTINIQLCFGELCIKQAITVKSLQNTHHHHHH